jgi:hypothetical protein
MYCIVYGWDLQQWRKAFDYFKAPDVEGLFMVAMSSTPDRDGARSADDREAFRKLAMIQRDWRMKRKDEPADTIIAADTYRARRA